ncbi:MAG: GIY-YIG nuclease family protein [Candidatus Moranbacteria bacterium]|nr:GIY-YIG nuclease family protein [Candidatus Moranbacteria bacterium]
MPKLWEKIQTFEAFRKKNSLPEVPGVYFFLDEKKKLLYIGKATSLRDRVKSYFSSDIGRTRGLKIERMLEKVGFVAHRKTDSVLEALILEASLIKVHQPSYNTDAKDDKSYNHVVITKELFPRVLIVRGRDLGRQEPITNNQRPKTDNQQQKMRYKYVFGPFPAGGALREAMKIVRKLFPFRDRCIPFEEKSISHLERSRSLPAGGQGSRGRRRKNSSEILRVAQNDKPPACFNRQIGLCPGVCTGEITAREYARTINHIRLFFEGHKGMLIKKLEREMKTAAKNLEFESAGGIKKTLFGLRHIQDMALIKNDQQPITNDQQEKMRIEAYDVAHLGGSASVGVMVVLQNGRSAKEFYRKFTLRGGHEGNDLTALEEILKRRLKHLEWPLPEIIVVDGALLQLGVAEQVSLSLGITIPIVGVVKNTKHQPERLIGPETLTRRFKKEILLANSEAHRFAITFHRVRRGKEFLNK